MHSSPRAFTHPMCRHNYCCYYSAIISTATAAIALRQQ